MFVMLWRRSQLKVSSNFHRNSTKPVFQFQQVLCYNLLTIKSTLLVSKSPTHCKIQVFFHAQMLCIHSYVVYPCFHHVYVYFRDIFYLFGVRRYAFNRYLFVLRQYSHLTCALIDAYSYLLMQHSYSPFKSLHIFWILSCLHCLACIMHLFCDILTYSVYRLPQSVPISYSLYSCIIFDIHTRYIRP